MRLFEPADYRDDNEDETLPTNFYKVKPKDYKYTNQQGKLKGGLTLGKIKPDKPGELVTYSAGHLAPAADRDENRSYILLDRRGEHIGKGKSKDGMAVGLMSNLIPQESGINQGQWKAIEQYTRDLVKQGKEAYVIAGTHGDKGQVSLDSDISITVPEYTWKVMLVLDNPGADATINTYTIGYWAENSYGSQVNTMSVNDIENLTGYDFFSNIPSEIQEIIEDNSEEK